MKTNDLIQKWNDLNVYHQYLQRLDADHPLDFFIGVDTDGYKELVLITEYEPSQMKSSKSVVVEKGKRLDGKWAIQIKLIDEENQEVFSSLCLDLIDSTYQYTNKLEGMKAVTARFIKWQKLLQNGTGGMSDEMIKGLIGELIFAKKILMKKYSLDEIIDSWLGPDGEDRDYVLNNVWFEVKAIATGKQTISISSLNQLDIDQTGYLAVIIIDATSASDDHGFSFSSLIEDYKMLLSSSPEALFKFEEKLINLGYYDMKEYHDKYYRLNNISLYVVDREFPRITPDNVHNAIISVKYEILIPGISKWKLEDNDLWI